MSDTPKRVVVGGRHRPPNASLTGRSGACKILGVDKRELRRMEASGVLKPAIVQPNGVRWFDIETVWRLALERFKDRKSRHRPRRPSLRPEGVERVTGAETRQITQWFAAGLSHAEVVVLSGKTHETIRYLYAQYITPNGAKVRMSSATPGQRAAHTPPDYYPEDVPELSERRHGARLPAAPTRALPPALRPGAPPPPGDPPPEPNRVAPATTPQGKALTHVPDSWFTDPLPPDSDDDDE
jgi:hypothetical protein